MALQVGSTGCLTTRTNSRGLSGILSRILTNASALAKVQVAQARGRWPGRHACWLLAVRVNALRGGATRSRRDILRIAGQCPPERDRDASNCAEVNAVPLRSFARTPLSILIERILLARKEPIKAFTVFLTTEMTQSQNATGVRRRAKSESGAHVGCF